MDGNIDDVISGKMSLVNIIVQGKGKFCHGPTWCGTVERCSIKARYVQFPQLDVRVIMNVVQIVKYERATQSKAKIPRI